MASLSPSLLAPSGQPVLESAGGWVNGTLLGGVAVTLCVLAVAFVGLMMLSGRFSIRRSARVVLGCFLLLGAPVIAQSFTGFWQGQRSVQVLPVVLPPEEEPRGDLPPAGYDPYAGASIRRD